MVLIPRERKSTNSRGLGAGCFLILGLNNHPPNKESCSQAFGDNAFHHPALESLFRQLKARYPSQMHI